MKAGLVNDTFGAQVGPGPVPSSSLGLWWVLFWSHVVGI